MNILFLAFIAFYHSYLGAMNTPSESVKSQEIQHPAPEQLEAQAQYKQACGYLQGEKSKANELEAFRLMKESADKGYIPALLELGFYYEYGIGTEIDFNQALDSYEKAVDLGSSKALERVNILKIPLCVEPLKSEPSSSKVTSTLELYYIHLLIGAYELYIERLEKNGSFATEKVLYFQHQTRYFLNHKQFPSEYQDYIKKWRKVADLMLELINTSSDSEFQEAWVRGVDLITKFEEEHPEISSVISFEQAKAYINRKYKLDIHIENHTKISKALSNDYDYTQSKIRLFKSLVRELSQISLDISSDG